MLCFLLTGGCAQDPVSEWGVVDQLRTTFKSVEANSGSFNLLYRVEKGLVHRRE